MSIAQIIITEFETDFKCVCVWGDCCMEFFWGMFSCDVKAAVLYTSIVQSAEMSQ